MSAVRPLTPVKKAPGKLQHISAIQRPPRVVLNAVEGWGKTSCAAHIPGAAILMAAGETGYETLLGNGLVPSIPAARISGWSDLLATVDDLVNDHDGIKAVSFDALGGFERACHEYVCKRDFGGDWGDKGFGSYQKGFDVSVTEWLSFLSRLDRLWDSGVAVVILSHCKVSTFKNPLGPDYDRYVSDVHAKTWAVTAKWADAVLFGNFLSVVDKNNPKDKKGKGIGGTDRVLYCERRDAWDAKNRYGMPEMIEIPDDASQTWNTIAEAMKKS